MSYKYIQASLQSVFLKNWFLLKKTKFLFSTTFNIVALDPIKGIYRHPIGQKTVKLIFLLLFLKRSMYLNCICVLITFWKRQRRFSYFRFEISFLGFIPNGCLTYSYPGHFEPRTLIILQKYKTKLISQVKTNN